MVQVTGVIKISSLEWIQLMCCGADRNLVFRGERKQIPSLCLDADEFKVWLDKNIS
jgi:hypothetical protein